SSLKTILADPEPASRITHAPMVSTLAYSMDSNVDAVAGIARWAEGIVIDLDAKAWRDLEDAERAIHDGLGAYAGDLALRVSSEELNLASVGYAPLREFSMRVYRDFLSLAADLRAPYLVVDAHFPHRSLVERDV